MTVSFRDQGLRKAFEGMLSDSRVTKAEVDKLIASAKDGPGLSKTEKADLEKLLAKVSDGFDADAKLAIELRWLERGVTARRRRNQGSFLTRAASISRTSPDSSNKKWHRYRSR